MAKTENLCIVSNRFMGNRTSSRRTMLDLLVVLTVLKMLICSDDYSSFHGPVNCSNFILHMYALISSYREGYRLWCCSLEVWTAAAFLVCVCDAFQL
jgi:hypothetical protein